VSGCCEHGNQRLGSMKFEEILPDEQRSASTGGLYHLKIVSSH
jgi:hypothetical protein